MSAMSSHSWDGLSMSLVTKGDWRKDEATRQAACLAALGVPVSPILFYRVREANEKVTYQHASISIWPEFAALGPIKETLREFNLGKLALSKPLHPLLDAMRAVRNAELLSEAVNESAPMIGLGYDAQRERTRMIAGPAVKGEAPYAKVISLALSAALGTLGFPLLALEQVDEHNARFVHPRLSVPMISDNAPRIHDASELLAGHRAGTLASMHPFEIAWRAASSWLQLCDVVSGEAAVVMFRNAQTRSAFITADAEQSKIDTAEGYAAGTRTTISLHTS